MKPDTLQKFRKLFGVLVAAVAAVLLLVSLFVAHVLQASQARYYANAAETAHNLAVSLENFLHSHFEEVDLAMRRAGVEFRDMQTAGRFEPDKFSAYLRTLRERIPNAQAVRGSDAAGRVVYGEQVDLAHPQDLTVREFFPRAKVEHELIIGLPVKSRISGEWVLPLVYPLAMPDGSFGGTAYTLMNSSRLTELFSSLNIGPHGSIVLLDDRRRVLHRYPFVDTMAFGDTIKVSPQTQAILEGRQKGGTYNILSDRDGLERTLSLQRVGRYPLYVAVALASEDFLAPWRKEVRNALIFLGVLMAFAAALLAGVWYAMRKQSQAVHQLLEADRALQASLARLTASESRWRSLTEGLPQMVWTVTPALRLDFISHQWERFSGMPSALLIEAGDWSPVLHPDDRAALLAEWRRAAATGDAFRCDCRLRRLDGAWRIFDNHALPQKDGDGRVLGWVGSSTDATEARAAHDALRLAKEAADQAGRAKSEFVANMSHEIRSPMNAVLGMLQLLQQTEMSERQQDYAAKAHAAASALLGLLNDILDFSKVEAGKLALDPHPFRLDKLWRDLAVILSANVGSKNIEVLFRIDPQLPALVVGDALRLQQILLNLAGNAIKFTEQGEVVLSARLQARGAGTLTIAFAIRDSGIGISEEQRLRIFDGFSQAEASTARRYGGTGLGLAISQRLVRLMGGELGVTSTLGQGSVFEFAVECGVAPASPGAPDIAPAAPERGLLKGLSCLVVDDNPMARMVLSEMAQSFGWRVDVAVGGREALAAVTGHMAAQHPYDVVLIDWRMPAFDGWETSCEIRKLAPHGKLPLIVMVTAHDRELLAQRHMEMEPVLDGFVVKPVTASMLFDAVADARMEKRAPLAAVALPSLRRLAGLRLLLVDDNPANQQVASELLGNEGAQVEVASSGRMAIDAASRPGPPPHLILMDIQMPEMDGYEATHAIQRLLGAHAPPIVAMTANAMPADRVAALDAGMVDHIGKPFDLVQLIAVILRHARRAGMPLGMAAPAVEAAAAGVADAANVAPLAETGINSAAALKRLGGLHSVYLVALRSFAVEAGKLSAQLQAAGDGQDGGAALPLLHTLKGLAGTVGADRLAGLAHRAEQALKADPGAAGCAQLAPVIDAIPGVVDEIERLARQLDPAGALSQL
ncbi:response regulator [Duganella sp. BJB1802]|uniref:response regulator n=1 Tax=Duganella sp. BJB1802 TaxID=2744575 RepID=UPI00159471D9|nr:response regulator [Duganella sp. BJB1802]NVD71014.1 response regulator [Duganella sp. BJB1802]